MSLPKHSIPTVLFLFFIFTLLRSFLFFARQYSIINPTYCTVRVDEMAEFIRPYLAVFWPRGPPSFRYKNH